MARVLLALLCAHGAAGQTPALRGTGQQIRQAEIAWPDLQGLTDRLDQTMRKYQSVYYGDPVPADCEGGFSEQLAGYLPGCPEPECSVRATLEEAKALCITIPTCGGITNSGGNNFQLREGTQTGHSPGGEVSWVRRSCNKATPQMVWEAFQTTMAKALDDPSLHLSDPAPPARNDSSIFISIAAYRDRSCQYTVRNAFQRADHPERLSVGVVQINCYENCETGSGWGSTRHMVKTPADADCIEEFCATELGKPHCDAGRVRILRLKEVSAMGPFFTRFLNSKLWRGENFFMQIDAHMGFREGWDSTLVQMIHKTKSYPYSVISHYPDSGTAEDTTLWQRATSSPSSIASLCSMDFEKGEAEKSWTVRLGWSSSAVQHSTDAVAPPPYGGFIAAGFFFTHGVWLSKLPPDPFLPYIFMGEEIALSIKFWTAGFDIYAPSVSVISHEYVRKESTKFWETVNKIFSNGGMHNALTDLIIPRVQHLVGFPEAFLPSQVNPPSLLDHFEGYNVSTVRSRELFLSEHGIDLIKKRQTTPQWCTQGHDPDPSHEL